MISLLAKLVVLLEAVAVYAQQPMWAQCGGDGWDGGTICIAGTVCTVSNKYYSQCLPSSSSSVSSSSFSSSSFSSSSVASSTPTTPPNTSITLTTSVTTSTPTSALGRGPGTVLQTGYYWIRSVEDPNYHQYLQTSPMYVVGTAILSSYTTAGQFQIVNGQLVQLLYPSLLYANVQVQANSSVVKLSVSFQETANTYGTFSWSGDAVQWSVPSIARPNPSAWLVCADQSLWINLGNYGYETPAGCVDETIHYYNAAAASD